MATPTQLLRRFEPGERVGKYTVVSGPDRIRASQYYRCTCECQKVCWVGASSLREGAIRGPDKRPLSCKECSNLARYGPKVVRDDEPTPPKIEAKPMAGYSRWRK